MGEGHGLDFFLSRNFENGKHDEEWDVQVVRWKRVWLGETLVDDPTDTRFADGRSMMVGGCYSGDGSDGGDGSGVAGNVCRRWRWRMMGR